MRRSARIAPAATTSNTTTMTSIAADLEDAMLYSCLSNDKDKIDSSPAPKARIALSPNGSFASLDESTDDSDSDISLCRNTRKTRRNNNCSYSDDDPTDGDCTTPVSSVASLLFGTDNPCSLHLEDDTKSTQTKPVTPRRPPPVPQKSPQKSALKQPQQQPSIPKKVQFTHVHIREYSLCLSQNPSCSEGPPIELGWKYRPATAVQIDQYETVRHAHRRKRLPELLLGAEVRRRMLAEFYTPDEIARAVRDVEDWKRQRIITYMLLPASALDEAAEEWVHYLSHVFWE